MKDNIQNHLVALKWWSLRGQDWLYYCTVLHAGSAPDGLEFWAASIASGFHLNLVQRGQGWSSRLSGLEYNDFTLMVLEDGFVYCDCVNSDQVLGLRSRGRSDGGIKSPCLKPLDLSFSKDKMPCTRSKARERRSHLPLATVKAGTCKSVRLRRSSTLPPAEVTQKKGVDKPIRKNKSESFPCIECKFHGKSA